MSETMYAIRRADGELIDDYAFLIVGSPTDWSPAEDDARDGFDAATYELVEMTVKVVDRRTLPVCHSCDEPAVFWGLCEPHAREDDPEHFAEVPS